MALARVSRCVGVAVVAVLASLVVPSPAEAHTRTQETTNVDSRLTSTPDLPGVSWQVHTGGLLVEVENRSDAVLVVAGYEGEPYLRIGPDGVERNRRSPATYLNQERYADVAVPPHVDPAAEPEWIRVADEPRYLWHDHRTHWMSTEPPSFVDARPVQRVLMRARLVGPIGSAGSAAGVFHEWSLPILYDGQTHEVRGEMAWVDPPSAAPWLALAGLVLVPMLLVMRGRDRQAMIRPAALAVAGVAALNLIHLVDDLVAFPSDPLDELFGLLHTTFFLSLGLGGALWALRGSFGRMLALGISSAAVLYHQGLLHLPMLFASQFPTVWPDAFVRLTVGLGVVQAVVVAAVLVRPPRRDRPRRPGQPAARPEETALTP